MEARFLTLKEVGINMEKDKAQIKEISCFQIDRQIDR